ncbi:MAG: helix-turn-helix transcriptional regulator [Pseudomonadota bacterium]
MPDIAEEEYDFLGRLAIAQSVEDFENAAVSFCSELFAVQSVIAMRYHSSQRPEILFRWTSDERLRSIFNQYYESLGYMLDPFYKLSFEVTDWKACPLREIAPDRFEASDYFSKYFGVTKMVDELGFVARTSETTAVHLSIGRNHGKQRFRAKEANKFKSVSKVLAPKLKSLVDGQSRAPTNSAPALEQRFLTLSIDRGEEISMREAEVATLIVQGHSSRAISLKLGISGHTVKVHRRNLYGKLGISSQSELFGLLTAFVEL